MSLLEGKIQELLERLLLMGRLAESMVQTALRVLIERDESLAAEIHRKEKEVNALQIEIDDTAVKLTALQQPVGTDVRFLFMASRIATELERIGDQAVNIVENAHHVLKAPPLGVPPNTSERLSATPSFQAPRFRSRVRSPDSQPL